MIPYLIVAGSLLQAYGAAEAGSAAAEQGRRQYQQNLIAAGQAKAAAQRDAMEETRKGKLIASRALAVAAASGGGASDPSVVNTIADIDGEGAYRASVALYGGEEESRRLITEGKFAQYEGQQKRSAYRMQAATSLISGITEASIYSKYA
jgi:hypothetical protein